MSFLQNAKIIGKPLPTIIATCLVGIAGVITLSPQYHSAVAWCVRMLRWNNCGYLILGTAVMSEQTSALSLNEGGLK